MLQLGFVFNVISDGLRTVHECNAQGQTWRKSIPDLRGDFSVLPNLDGSGKTVYQLRFLGAEGFLIALVKPQEGNMGRGADHSAAWIHVPACAKISGEELVNVLNDVEQAISRKEGTDTDKLNSVFAKEYSENSLRQPMISRLSSKADGPIAVRNYSATPGENATLTEVLDALAQSVYAEYKSVFLVDVVADLQVAPTVKTITEPLKKLVVVEPPEAKDNFVPYICVGTHNPEEITGMSDEVEDETEHEEVFKETREIEEGETLTIRWKRDGFAPIEKKVEVKSNINFGKVFEFTDDDVKRHFVRDFFNVISSKEEPISNAEISIDNQLLTEDGLCIPKKDEYEIHVHADEYEDYKESVGCNPLSTEQPMSITLKKSNYVYDGDLLYREIVVGRLKCSIDRELYDFTDSDSLTLVLNGDDWQIRSPKSTFGARWISKVKLWPCKVKMILIFLAIVLGFGLWFAKNATDNAPRIEKNNNPDSETGPFSSSEDSLEMVKAYLDKNRKWSRDSLEKFSSSKGLFDVLNNYQLRDLSKYQTIVDKSKKLQRIVDCKKQLNGSFPQDKYCNDNEITVDKYINKLERTAAQDETKSTIESRNNKATKNIPGREKGENNQL